MKAASIPAAAAFGLLVTTTTSLLLPAAGGVPLDFDAGDLVGIGADAAASRIKAEACRALSPSRNDVSRNVSDVAAWLDAAIEVHVSSDVASAGIGYSLVWGEDGQFACREDPVATAGLDPVAVGTALAAAAASALERLGNLAAGMDDGPDDDPNGDVDPVAVGGDLLAAAAEASAAAAAPLSGLAVGVRASPASVPFGSWEEAAAAANAATSAVPVPLADEDDRARALGLLADVLGELGGALPDYGSGDLPGGFAALAGAAKRPTTCAAIGFGVDDDAAALPSVAFHFELEGAVGEDAAGDAAALAETMVAELHLLAGDAGDAAGEVIDRLPAFLLRAAVTVADVVGPRAPVAVGMAVGGGGGGDDAGVPAGEAVDGLLGAAAAAAAETAGGFLDATAGAGAVDQVHELIWTANPPVSVIARLADCPDTIVELYCEGGGCADMLSHGDPCWPELTCDRCDVEATLWTGTDGKYGFHCGEEPCWERGTECVPAIGSCGRCCEGHGTSWFGAVGHCE